MVSPGVQIRLQNMKNRLGIVVSSAMGIPEAEQLPLVLEAGFESFFTVWSEESPVAEIKKTADELGLYYHSIHGPSGERANVTHLWSKGEACGIALAEIMRCLEVCSENEVGIMVSHAHSGFDFEYPTPAEAECAFESFGALADRARELGVKLALENIECVGFLEAVLDRFKDHPAVGYCFDIGHERCYCGGEDLLARFGHRLIATHIHDNLGAGGPDGKIGSRDDLHMLPFDGIIDWENAASRLCALGYGGDLMLEVKKSVWYSDRHENDIYNSMTPKEFITEAYRRGIRLKALIESVEVHKTI